MICVEVLNFLRPNDHGISDVICSMVSMDAIDPPRIIAPYEDELIPSEVLAAKGMINGGTELDVI